MWTYVGINELYHYGIKGQEWGIRRYQNEDGSLTEEGKRRYAEMYDSNSDTFWSRTKSIEESTIDKNIIAAGKLELDKSMAESGNEVWRNYKIQSERFKRFAQAYGQFDIGTQIQEHKLHKIEKKYLEEVNSWMKSFLGEDNYKVFYDKNKNFQELADKESANYNKNSK